MSRLLTRYWDILFAKFPKEMSEELHKNLIAVDISEAARWIMEDSPQEIWDYRQDFPSLAPPWPFAWYEWRTPRFVRDGDKITHLPMRPTFGCLVISFPVPKNLRQKTLAADIPFHLCQFSKQATAEQITERRQMTEVALASGLEIGWLCKFSVVAQLGSKPPKWLSEYWTYLDMEGKPITELSLEAAPIIVGLSIEVCFAISLLHCKNVEVVDIPIAAKVQQSREDKGYAGILYKTLVVNSLRHQARAEIGEDREPGASVRRALHIVRGHFKDYRDTGLFGKHHDIYWWDMYARGDIGQGEIRKDYVVRP